MYLFFMCMSALLEYACVTYARLMLWRPEEGAKFPGTEFMVNWKATMWVPWTQPSPLQEQQVLLTMMLSLWLIADAFKIYR